MNFLLDLWPRLCRVQALHFESKSRTGSGWVGVGSGQVEASQPQDDVLIWQEHGQWKQNGGRDIRFFNTFRWTKQDGELKLEHLRFGAEQPVFLFQLAPISSTQWRDVEPHLCRTDNYSASLEIEDECLQLSWTVFGPTKDESINYVYR